ncbi:phenylalanine--tRNA ligase subunit alpha, partial [bacterium]|nr:phenylalanine--tRNA ligase subunit alpha [bacterium]
MQFLQDLEALIQSGVSAFQEAQDPETVESLRISYLGRKGKLAECMQVLPSLSQEEKRAAGPKANEVKMALEGAWQAAVARLQAKEAAEAGEKERIDITLPPAGRNAGHLHLTSQAIEEICAIFSKLGFARARHPEIDWDYFAFESLNMPKEHPARDEWETFFVDDGRGKIFTGTQGKVVLTPHTSNGQVREMLKGNMPIRMISIGKCYRRQVSARHLPMFHQFEGLMIDEHVTITELKGVFDYFVKRYFGENRETRLRPFHFRFTEPSFELDISCAVCNGTGKVNGAKCKLCKEGWLE